MKINAEMLAKAGYVVKPKVEALTEEQAVAMVVSLLDQLDSLKGTGTETAEKAMKKIRRTLRKKFGVKVSELKKEALA